MAKKKKPRTLKECQLELRRCKRRLKESLDVLENVIYADRHGDWDILDAAVTGATRELKRNGRQLDDEDDED